MPVNPLRCLTARNILAAAGSAATLSALIAGCANGPRWDQSLAWGPDQLGLRKFASQVSSFGSDDKLSTAVESPPVANSPTSKKFATLPSQHPTREGLQEDPFLGEYSRGQIAGGARPASQKITQVEASGTTTAARTPASTERAEVIPAPRSGGSPSSDSAPQVAASANDAWMNSDAQPTAPAAKQFEFPARAEVAAAPAAPKTETQPVANTPPVNGFAEGFDSQLARLRVAMQQPQKPTAPPFPSSPSVEAIPESNPFERAAPAKAPTATNREAEIRAIIAAAKQKLEAGDLGGAQAMAQSATEMTQQARQAAEAEPIAAAPSPTSPEAFAAGTSIAQREEKQNSLTEWFETPGSAVAAREKTEKLEPQAEPEYARNPFEVEAARPTVATATPQANRVRAEIIPAPPKNAVATSEPAPQIPQVAAAPKASPAADQLPVIVSRIDRPRYHSHVEYIPRVADTNSNRNSAQGDMLVSAEAVPSRYEARALHQSGAAVYANTAPEAHQEWLQRNDQQFPAPPSAERRERRPSQDSPTAPLDSYSPFRSEPRAPQATYTSREIEREVPPFSEPEKLDPPAAALVPLVPESATVNKPARLSNSHSTASLQPTELSALQAVDWDADRQPEEASGVLSMLRNPVLLVVGLGLLFLVALSFRRRWQVG